MIALVLAAVLAAEPATAATEHYQVRSAALDPAEAGAILEQLHGCLTDFFGVAPPGPLQVEIFADAESFRGALAADGQPAVAAGGYYAPENQKVYLFAQPSAYFTRQLLLHEATHQFHFLTSTGNRRPRVNWHVEGLAELFGMHNWQNGSSGRLQCCVVPAVSLEDYPAKALAEIEEHADQPDWLCRVIAGEVQASRPLNWALAHFLIHRDRAAFRDLVARLDRDEDALESFGQTFGESTPELFDDFRRWTAAHQQPWSVVWIEWQESGEALEGFSHVVGLVIHKTPLERLQATIEPAQSPWKAGGVFGLRNEGDFYLVELSDSGSVRVLQRAGSRWQPLLTQRLTCPSQTFTIERRGYRVAVRVGTEIVYERDAPGKMGLFVDACRAKFSSIVTTP